MLSLRSSGKIIGSSVSIRQLAQQHNLSSPISLRELLQALGVRDSPIKHVFAVPRRILEIQYDNPAVPTDPNWASSGAKTYPESRDLEWSQVLGPQEEYDEFTLVGASGWITDKEESQADVPFSHPFGFDWEFEIALDDRFESLLSPANGKGGEDGSDESITEANELLQPVNVTVPPNGLLGVEWDKGLLPRSYRDQVQPGDRVAIFGRWILDQGHDVDGSYRTEIHPPLLVANASLQKDGNGAQSTRVVFMSRPYLPGQRYTVDPKDAYKDGAADDGPLFSHLLRELGKVIGIPILGIPLSTQVEAHPKIKSLPFRGAHLLRIIVRPPSLGLHDVTSHRLALSFHFTVRTGVAVQVTSTAEDTIEVFIALSHGAYTPPPLPKRTDHVYSREQLNELSEGSGIKILELEALATGVGLLAGGAIGAAKVAAILSLGIKTDDYQTLLERNVLDAGNAAHVFANNIPAGAGVTQDNAQPYPVYGWLEAKWVYPDVVLG